MYQAALLNLPYLWDGTLAVAFKLHRRAVSGAGMNPMIAPIGMGHNLRSTDEALADRIDAVWHSCGSRGDLR